MFDIQRYSNLIIFTVLFFVGLFIRYFGGEGSSLWSIWSSIDVSFAVVLGVLAFLAYRDLVKEKDLIRLILNVEDSKHIDTNLCLLRKNCTRGEIIGLIKMLNKTNKPLKYDVKNLHKLLDELNRVQSSRVKRLYIPINKDELEQFNLKP